MSDVAHARTGLTTTQAIVRARNWEHENYNAELDAATVTLLVDLVDQLRDERDQALIRAEAAEAELDAYRRAERVQERRAS